MDEAEVGKEDLHAAVSSVLGEDFLSSATLIASREVTEEPGAVLENRTEQDSASRKISSFPSHAAATRIRADSPAGGEEQRNLEFATADKNGSSSSVESVLEIEKEPICQTTVANSFKVPYNNGYGDFCFGRFIDRYDKSAARNDNSLVAPELDGFQRTGLFRYFDLPREIRQRIFQFLLWPLFTTCDKTGGRYIQIQLERNPYAIAESQYSRSEYSGDFNYYYLSHGKSWLLKAEMEDGPAALKIMEEDFLIQKEIYSHKRKIHPGRAGCVYNVLIDPWEVTVRGGGPNRVFHEWIRQISNTSSVFRQELGDVFWQNTEVELINEECFHEFLKDRPAVAKGIRRISLFASLLEGNAGLFAEVCSAIGMLPDLRSLRLDIVLYSEDLEHILAVTDSFAGMTSSRTLRVKEVFHVNLAIIPMIGSGPDYGPCLDGCESKEKDLCPSCKAVPLIREIMMPDSLRAKPLLTKMDAYLHHRSETATSSSIDQAEQGN